MDLTPELLQEIQAAISDGRINPSGRSPVRERQLHDLRILPSAKDPRPLFIPSAEAPLNAKPYVHQQYPGLRWHKDTGEERAVASQKDADALGPEWIDTPVHQKAFDPLESAAAALASLSEKEREAIMEQQHDLRMQKLQAQLAALSELDLDAVLMNAKKQATGKAKKTA